MHKRKRQGPFQTAKPLILGSGSPRRAELLQGLGLDFRIVITNTTEAPFRQGNPEDYALEIAESKIRCVSQDFPEDWIIAADTIVVIDKHVLGKPNTKAEAHSMLRQLSGHWHVVISAFCVGHRNKGAFRKRAVQSRVKMRRLTESEIWSYIDTGEPMDKAGSYAIQGMGAFMIEEMQGSYTNVVGLPLSELVDVLLSLQIIRPTLEF